MQIRAGLLALAASTLVACSLLVDSGGLSGGDPPASADAASDGPGGDDAARARDASEDGPAIHPYVQAVLADAPVLYYRLEETADGAVKDEAGNYPATYLPGGTHAVPGVFPGSRALRLEGPGGIDAGDVLDFVGVAAYTLEGWLLPEAYDESYRFIFHRNNGEQPRQSYGIFLHSRDGITFERYIDDESRAASAPTPSVGTWHHIAGVYDGAVLQLFIDGALAASRSDDRAAKMKLDILRVGYGGADLEGTILGTLDELAIYDKALSRERIQAHVQAAR